MPDYRPQRGEKVFLGPEFTVAKCRYVGQTHFGPGEWVGLQLREKIGLNDGSIEGHRYFHCKPGFGVFVRSAVISPWEDDSGQLSPKTDVAVDDDQAQQEVAATRIQAQFRGQQTRKKMGNAEDLPQVERKDYEASTLQSKDAAALMHQLTVAVDDLSYHSNSHDPRDPHDPHSQQPGHEDLEEIERSNKDAATLQSSDAAMLMQQMAAAYEDPAEEAAATKIQAQFRGKKDRESVKAKQEAKARLGVQDPVVEQPGAWKVGDEAKPADAAEQPAGSGAKTREEEEEEIRAATKIQAQIRGKNERRTLAAKQGSADPKPATKPDATVEEKKQPSGPVVEQPATKSDASKPKDDDGANAEAPKTKEEEEEEVRAATKIQAQIRGKNERRALEASKQQTAGVGAAAHAPTAAPGAGTAATATAATTAASAAPAATATAATIAAAEKDKDDKGTVKPAEAKTKQEEDEEARAATKIQAQIRGKNERRALEASKQQTAGVTAAPGTSAASAAPAASAASATTTHPKETATTAAATKEKDEKGLVKPVQAKTKQEEDEEARAATKIQAQIRGKNERRALEASKQQIAGAGAAPAAGTGAAPTAGTSPPVTAAASPAGEAGKDDKGTTKPAEATTK